MSDNAVFRDAFLKCVICGNYSNGIYYHNDSDLKEILDLNKDWCCSKKCEQEQGKFTKYE